MTTLRLIKSIWRSLLRHHFFLLSLALVLVCFGFSPKALGATFAPTEEERVAATDQGLNEELKLAVLPRNIDPEGRTYVEVDDMLFWVREGAEPESAVTGNRWTNGIVYYVFDAAVSSTNRQNWRNAAAAWSAVAPLTFTETTGIGNYIYVQNGTGNNSYVGMIGGRQVMNILNWPYEYVIAHEIGHALGLIHEHQRSGRDSFVTINYSYIQSEYRFAFDIAGSTNYGPYDFDSVMHYDKCAFSTDCPTARGCACTHYTITVPPPNTQWQGLIGQRTHLSQLDGAGMAQRYMAPGYNAPVVATNPATYVASFSVTLNGSVDPNGLTTSVYFQYGTTTSYGFTTAPHTKTGYTPQSVSAHIAGLTASTIYHFRIVATNSAGTRYGSDRTFTTLNATGRPVVITNPATSIAGHSARLNGTVNPHGLSTTVYFQYGRTTGYGSRTPNHTKTGNNYQDVFANISGLSAHTTYHFRIVASNTAGARYGPDRTFSTR
jgi:Astacin (Peptidase family M12A)